MKRGEIRGQGRPFNNSMRYHRADRHGWLYLCDCMPGFRTPYGIKYPFISMRKGK